MVGRPRFPATTPVTTVDTLQSPSLLVGGTAIGSASEGDDDAASDEGSAEAFQESRRSANESPINLGSDDDNDGDNSPNQGAPTRRSKPKARGTSAQRERLRGGAGEGLKRLLESTVAQKEARNEKRAMAS